jgi:hypothetical protein
VAMACAMGTIKQDIFVIFFVCYFVLFSLRLLVISC